MRGLTQQAVFHSKRGGLMLNAKLRSNWSFDVVPSPRQTGLLVAAASTPHTFSPSLAPRTSVDQGTATALAVGSHYLVTALTADLSRSMARRLADSDFLRNSIDGDNRDLWFALGVDALLVPFGTAVLLTVPSGPSQPIIFATARAAGRRAVVCGAAGASLASVHAVVRWLDAQIGPLPGGVRLTELPVAIPLGFVVALLRDLERRGPDTADDPNTANLDSALSPTTTIDDVSTAAKEVVSDLARSMAPDDRSASRWRSLLVAGGVAGTLSGIAALESGVARGLGTLLSSHLPGSAHVWQRVARLSMAGGVAIASATLWDVTIQRVEADASTEERLRRDVSGPELAGPTVSGGPRSLVPWSSLGREGRRHVVTGVAPAQSMLPRLGLPEDSIDAVTGAPALATPVQVYVGLDAAPTARERVDLALAEMEALGAFDRSLIVLISPTGTGYINHAALAALHYLSRGDVATAAMQYSRRPSPLAMTQLKDAREQNRLFWLEIVNRLRHRPGPRPRLAIFGESLGARTSQDVFADWGTLGPEALGIDAALWIGTPAGSAWPHQVMDDDRPDSEPGAVRAFNDIAQLDDLSLEEREVLRYYLVSHDDDGVVTFEPGIAVRRPSWFDARRASLRATTPAGASPRGLPPGMRWSPVTSFFHSVIDMKNSQKAGRYEARAHDYRPDLPRFISAAFRLPVTEDVMMRVEAAVRDRELAREQLFAGTQEAPA